MSVVNWLLAICCKNELHDTTAGGGGDDDGDDTYNDPLLWTRHLRHHSLGEFSAAAVQANRNVEDQLQVDVCRRGTFVGIYDGHAGDDCSRYIARRLVPNFMMTAKRKPDASFGATLRDAFLLTDEEFLAVVDEGLEKTPILGSSGSCCLVGIIWGGTIWVANAGDSRAVLGRVGDSSNVVAEQLSEEHNARIKSERRSLVAQHPNDPSIVVCVAGVWRVKGISQYTRAIGDADLKRPDSAVASRFARYRHRIPLSRAVLTAEPSIHEHPIQPEDRFLIFASDGLWDHVTNEEAVAIVAQNPRDGIAKRLVRAAIQAAQASTGQTYEFVKKVNRGDRRSYHDDITVVVVYIDQDMVGNDANVSIPELTIRAFTDIETSSILSLLDENRSAFVWSDEPEVYSFPKNLYMPFFWKLVDNSNTYFISSGNIE
ncbi:unnamed protein product [Victoria cruziana]